MVKRELAQRERPAMKRAVLHRRVILADELYFDLHTGVS